MPQVRWLGLTNDYNTASNWDSGAVPIDADDIIFDETSDQPVTSVGDQTGVTPNSVFIAAGYGDSSIGSSGDPLVYLTVPETIIESTGTIHYGLTTSATNNLTLSSDSTVILHGPGSPSNIFLQQGNLTILADVGTVSNLELNFIDRPLTDAVCNVQGTGTIGFLFANAGVVTSTRNITGMFIGDIASLIQLGDQPIGTLIMFGGSLVYKSTANITFVIAMGGLLDFSELTKDITISTLRLRRPGTILGNSNITVITGFGPSTGEILP